MYIGLRFFEGRFNIKQKGMRGLDDERCSVVFGRGFNGLRL